jgi:ATP-binding cassette subfamily C exporter for protease/lipase
MRRPLPQASPEIRHLLGEFRHVFWSVGSFSLAVNLLMLMPTIYMLQIYDRVLSSRNEFTLLMLTIIMVGVYALEALLELIRSGVLIRAASALELRLGKRVFDAAFAAYLKTGSGNPGQPLADLGTLRQFFAGKGLLVFFDAPWTPLFVVAIFLLHPWLGLFALVSVLLLATLVYVTERLTTSRLAEANALAQGAADDAANHLRNAEVIAAMGMLANFRRRWQSRQAAGLKLQADAGERNAWMGSAGKFLRLLTQSGILGVGALLVLENRLTPGGMIAASILLGRALSPIDMAIGTWRSTILARSSYLRLSELLKAIPPPAAAVSLPRPEGLVVAENLVLSPPSGGTPVIRGVSFGASPGMLVAVVGPSASGKSSLARGLVGVWHAVSGTMRLDHADVAQWDTSELGPWIGYLPQDVELFTGTVADNIARFGLLDSEKVVQAARRARAHEMILRLPQGYETPVGESGAKLSGGQRQRIGLARALYGDPALVVLDEPNANLDEVGDAALLDALQQLKREKRTTFVMTHRKSILQIADAVMVLEDGRIKAYGKNMAGKPELVKRAAI